MSYPFIGQKYNLPARKFFDLVQIILELTKNDPFLKNFVQKVLAQNVAFNHQGKDIANQNLIFSLSSSLGLKVFQSFAKAICVFAQIFF